MIKIIEQGQKTFIRTCDRCGCKFQYDLSDLGGLDYISCPCCHTTLTHIGPKTTKIDLSKTNKIDWIDTGKINVDDIRKHTTTTPYKVEVGDGKYNYATTTGQYVNPSTVTTISDVTKPSAITGGDPNATIYAGKLPDDIVDDPYNKIGNDLPDDIDGDLPDVVEDDCSYTSERFKEWHDNWVKIMKENAAIECKNKK